MRKLSLLIISLLSGVFCYSQLFTTNKYNKTNSVIQSYNGKYGLMNDEHHWIIKPLYDDLGNSNFYSLDNLNVFDSKGFITASKNGKYGLINEKEEIIIPFIFIKIDSFDKNENAIASIKEVNSNQEKFGIINRSGDWIFKSKYEGIFRYSKDQIYDNKGYLLAENNNKFGFIDKNNVVKIPFLFDYLSSFDDNGLAVAFQYKKKYHISDSINSDSIKIDSKCGVIDRKGNWVIPPKYYHIKPFSKNNIFDSNGYLKVQMGSEMNYTMGYLTRKGKFITGFSNPALLNDYESNMAILLYCDTISKINESKCKYGVINRKGKWIISPIYDDIVCSGNFLQERFFDSNGYLLVEKNKKRGFVDYKNNIKIPIAFDNLTSFDIHNHSIASLNDSVYDSESNKYKEVFKTGVIDRKGKWLLNPNYEEILPYRDTIGLDNSHTDPKGFLMVKKNDKWGFLDKDFKVKVPFIYDTLDEFDDKDFACACTKINESYYRQKCGFINRNGEWVIAPNFQLLRPFNAIGLALARLNNREGYINRQGEFILEFDKQSD